MNVQFNFNNEKSIQSLAMDFLTVVQQAAIAAHPWVGRGNKIEADRSGTEAMRNKLNTIDMLGTVVIGEGELDEAPMLYIGEKLGTGQGVEVDIAVDPVEGTSLMAKGQDHSIAVIAVAKKGCLLHAPDMYMKKLAVGPKAKGAIDLNKSLTENMKSVAKAMGKDVKDLTVIIQDRERHDDLVQEVFELGAKVKLFSDGDVNYAVATALDELDGDIMVGIGGAPEGVIAAAALKCLGGDFQAQLVAQNVEEMTRCQKMGLEDLNKVLYLEDIVKTDDCFFAATGITDGALLRGVKQKDNMMVTHSFLSTGGGLNHSQFVEVKHSI